MQSMLEKKYKVCNTIVSEMDIMRFFTTIDTLGLVKGDTSWEAYERLLAKLPKVGQ